METAREFLEKKLNNLQYQNYSTGGFFDAIWIEPDQYSHSLEYLKKVARQMGFSAKGKATIIIYKD